MLRSALRTRVLALVFGLLTVAGFATGCQSRFGDLRLTIATGSDDGIYFELGGHMATIWASQLGIPKPTVLTTAGSVENVQRLLDGTADIGFGDADTIDGSHTGPPPQLRALARIYDDYIQVVVRSDESIDDFAQLSGKRMSVGADGSQTQVVAGRLLRAAGVHGVKTSALDLDHSIKAIENGQIDGFFWSGGLPTNSLTTMARSLPVKLLNLGTDPSGVLHTMENEYPVYGTAQIPAGTYVQDAPAVTTLTVPNFLLVTTRMPNDVAEALVSGMFEATGTLAGVNPAALGIDMQSAIYTEPVPLHPGAEAYYRSRKP